MDSEPIPITRGPRYTWRVTREPGRTVLIQTVNERGGVGEQEMWCTVDQAHDLAVILAAI